MLSSYNTYYVIIFRFPFLTWQPCPNPGGGGGGGGAGGMGGEGETGKVVCVGFIEVGVLLAL